MSCSKYVISCRTLPICCPWQTWLAIDVQSKRNMGLPGNFNNLDESVYPLIVKPLGCTLQPSLVFVLSSGWTNLKSFLPYPWLGGGKHRTRGNVVKLTQLCCQMLVLHLPVADTIASNVANNIPDILTLTFNCNKSVSEHHWLTSLISRVDVICNNNFAKVHFFFGGFLSWWIWIIIYLAQIFYITRKQQHNRRLKIICNKSLHF